MKKTLQFRRERSFVMVDYAVVMSGQLSVYELAVYLVLCAYSDSREGTCFPSYQTIAGKAGCSRRKAIDAVARLESLGLIRKEVRKNPCGDNTSNLYTIVAAPPIAAPPSHAEVTPADARRPLTCLCWDRQGFLQVGMQGFEDTLLPFADCPFADPFLPGNPGPGQPVPVELPDQRPVGSRKAVQGRREEKVSFPALQGVQRVLSRCRQDLQHVSSFFPHGAEIQGPVGLIPFRLVALPALSAIVCSIDLPVYRDKCFPDPDQILFTV